MQESDKRIFEIYLESNFLIYVDDKWSDGNISILLHMNINISMFFFFVFCRYSNTHSKHNSTAPEPIIDISRIDNEHVPLCCVNDVQLRFLVPDDLTEVCI